MSVYCIPVARVRLFVCSEQLSKSSWLDCCLPAGQLHTPQMLFDAHRIVDQTDKLIKQITTDRLFELAREKERSL